MLLYGFTTAPALGYIDPGTGSAVLQGLLGALAALALTFKLWWHKFLVLIGVRKPSQRTESEAGQSHRESDEDQ